MSTTTARRILVVGVPLAFAVISYFHPVPLPIADLADEVGWWTVLHMVQIPLFLLLGCAVLTVGWPLHGRTVTVSRIATLVFIAVYPAFDAYAGLGSGFMVRYAEDQSAPARQVLYDGAGDLLGSPVNGVLWGVGTLAWMVALVSLGLALRHGPGGRTVMILFAAAGVVLIDHGGVTGVASLILFAAAAALLEYRVAAGPTPPPPAPPTAAPESRPAPPAAPQPR